MHMNESENSQYFFMSKSWRNGIISILKSLLYFSHGLNDLQNPGGSMNVFVHKTNYLIIARISQKYFI